MNSRFTVQLRRRSHDLRLTLTFRVSTRRSTHLHVYHIFVGSRINR